MDGQNFQNGQNTENGQGTPVNNYQDNTSFNQYQVPPTSPQQAPKQTNVLAIVSLVMGILAIVLGCCSAYIGIIPGIAGIVCAIFANKQGKTGLAKAGLICSIVGIVIALVITILGVVVLSILSDYGYYY